MRNKGRERERENIWAPEVCSEPRCGHPDPPPAEWPSVTVQGAQWVGNFWTQNSYGFGYSSTPFLDDALLNWLGTSYLWWFDHIGDGGQTLAGLADVPAGMLCDNGNPTGCNYMQCGPGRYNDFDIILGQFARTS